MATLQKFKLLATQCAKSASPTQSPTTSPVFQLRRRKTLKMFLSRSGSGTGAANGTTATARRLDRRADEQESTAADREATADSAKKGSLIGNKLKDLFVSSPPSAAEKGGEESEVLIERVRRTRRGGGGGGGGGRSVSGAYRYRLLRRAWRPVLVTIPE